MCNDVCANTASKGVEAIEKEILDLETMLKEHIDSLGRTFSEYCLKKVSKF
jgi:hypothetical protein